MVVGQVQGNSLRGLGYFPPTGGAPNDVHLRLLLDYSAEQGLV